jgi:hypothetical protein
LPGWYDSCDDPQTKNLRVWRDCEGDILSVSIPTRSLDLRQSETELRNWCRCLAQRCEAGLIEVQAVASARSPSASLIYKRLLIPAYVYTGLFFTSVEGVPLTWQVVAGEHGTTGVREAIITATLMNEGKLTIEDYERWWAQDPYDPSYRGVDRSVLRFVSDDESYDEQFPAHPLSKVRRVLGALPECVQYDSPHADKPSA